MYIVPPPHPLLPTSPRQDKRKRLLVRIFMTLTVIFLGLFIYQTAIGSSLIAAVYVAGFIISLVLSDIFRPPSQVNSQETDIGPA
ncbi:hypothetical protein ACLSU7_08765 [Bdellovibrio sp. HCB185ZH]|uniref:hypothetical protein n=1 Tax=Bdellovibrio sp. HCB185ZH TaxID=3394235 RepID=UPI0039A662A8